jgi:hypothetical protein
MTQALYAHMNNKRKKNCVCMCVCVCVCVCVKFTPQAVLLLGKNGLKGNELNV